MKTHTRTHTHTHTCTHRWVVLLQLHQEVGESHPACTSHLTTTSAALGQTRSLEVTLVKVRSGQVFILFFLLLGRKYV